MQRQTRRLRIFTASIVGAFALLTLVHASGADAFTIDDGHHKFVGGVFDPQQSLVDAPRWSANPAGGPGLHDGIQVMVDSGFAAAFGHGAAETQSILHGVYDAFDAWGVGAVDFDITLGGPLLEVNVQAVHDTDPIFTALCSGCVGYAFFNAQEMRSDRTLTNGQVLPGWVIRGGSIFINIEGFNGFANSWTGLGIPDVVGRSMLALMMHEIGHTMAVDHPNEFSYANMDTDGDPTTVIPPTLDPPFSQVGVFPVTSINVMDSNLPDLFTELGPDDLSALHVLYPVPEPGLPVLVLMVAIFAGRPRSGALD